jgi:acetate kinase
MNILVLNCGSSSVKFQLIETSAQQIASNRDQALAKGSIDKVKTREALVTFERAGGPRTTTLQPLGAYEDAIGLAIGCLSGPHIDGVGHRVVHGGEHFTASVIIDSDVIARIESCVELAPLHNPGSLKGIAAAQRHLPRIAHVAVFDTAFHQTLAPEAFLYGIPYLYYQKRRIRRYGFHGTSHRYLCQRYAQLRGGSVRDYRIITCHLGNGCSICAIDRGRSVDTSMGFTPLEGLMMGTRSGDVDPGALLHLIETGECDARELDSLLNRQSGLYGISGLSYDMRDLLGARAAGNRQADLAVRMFCFRAKKYIGAYLAVLDGADAVIFSGGIGERAAAVREMICGSLGGVGLQIDPAANAAATESRISAPESGVEAWVIPTNEELLIARDAVNCITTDRDRVDEPPPVGLDTGMRGPDE